MMCKRVIFILVGLLFSKAEFAAGIESTHQEEGAINIQSIAEYLDDEKSTEDRERRYRKALSKGIELLSTSSKADAEIIARALKERKERADTSTFPQLLLRDGGFMDELNMFISIVIDGNVPMYEEIG